MAWVILSLVPPALWVISDYFDKYYLTKLVKKGGGYSVVLASSAFGVLALLAIYLLHPGSIAINANSAIWLGVSGAVAVISYLFYIKALSTEEVSTIVPLFQLIPVFSYILGYFFLNEKLTSSQLLAMALVIAGGVLITLEFQAKKLKFKSSIFLIMVFASLISAFGNLIFKAVTIHENYWGANFWLYVGIIAFSLIMLPLVRLWREEFAESWRLNWPLVLKLSFAIEIFSIIAFLIFNFALLKAPIALVSVLSNGFQPVFILIFGVLFSIFLPRFSKENFSKGMLVQKTISIAIIVIGTYLLGK